jgi:hypothetical protein
MNSQDFALRMKSIVENNVDTEETHRLADSLLCEVLNDLGYTEGVHIFNNIDKWYD